MMLSGTSLPAHSNFEKFDIRFQLCRLVKIGKTLEFGQKFCSKFRNHKISVREFKKMKLGKFLLWAGFAQSKLSNHDAMTRISMMEAGIQIRGPPSVQF